MSFGFPLGFPKGTAVVAPTQVLLMHMNGTNGSTTFLDATGRHTPVYSGSGVSISTGQSKFGGAAGYGVSGQVNLDGSTDFNFGAGDFTIDLWMRATTASGTYALYTNSSTGYPIIRLDSLKISVQLSSGTISSAALSVADNTWYHVAVTRSAGTTRLFLGGVEAASAADSGSYAADANYPMIFHLGATSTECYIDELRVLKGSAAWTTDFSPPSAEYTPTDPVAPANTVAPAVTGTATVGQVLTTTDGTWTGTATITYAYQWYRSPSTAIGGATASTYTLVSGDAGFGIYCKVTATNAAGSANANSNTTAAVSQLPANTVAPAVTGTTTEGQTLTTTTGTWTGTPTPTYTYQWYRSPSTAIGSATASTYVLTATDVGNTIFCRVTATNTAGAVSADSNTTATITAPSSLRVLLLHMDGTDASTTFTDATGRHTPSTNGNAQVDTAQSKFGGAAAYTSDGTGWIGLDGSADFAFGTGDFTVDFWARGTSFSTSTVTSLYGNNTTADQVYIYVYDGVLRYWNTGADRILSSAIMSNNTWLHIAVTRASGTTRLFINGTQAGSNFSDSVNIVAEAGWPSILSYAGGFSAECWIDELRVVKGSAEWTSNFTAPSAPYS